MNSHRSLVFILAGSLLCSSCAVAVQSGLEGGHLTPSPALVREAVGAAQPVAASAETTPPEASQVAVSDTTRLTEPPAPPEGPLSPSKEGSPVLPSIEAPLAEPAIAPKPPIQEKPQYVSLNFENADIELVLRSIADITGINFIIGPGVKANVTMRTTTRVPASEVFSIMESVLEVNNLAAVKEGSYYKIVPIAVAQQEPQDVQVGKERAEERERYVTQIVHLDHLSADETAKILQSFLAKGAKMVVHKETNSLIIAGFSSTVRRLLDTVRALDIPSKRDNIQRIFVYFVENAKAAELANTLNTLYGRRDLVRGAAPGTRPGQPPTRPALGVPPPTSSQPPPAPGQPAPSPLPAPGQPPAGAALLPGTALSPGAEAAPGEVVGDVTIVSDEATNTLIIKTSPRNYEFIETTIKQLDIVPKQVLIELLIAEITLNDIFKLGIEEFLRTGDFVVQNTQGASPLPPVRGSLLGTVSGLTMTFVEGRAFQVFLNSLSQVTKTDILASPHLLTANNKEAKIQIGSEVPIITGEQSTSAFSTLGTTTPFKTVQQKDIGIIMGIKPHVNEKRLVTLDIETENTNVDQANFGGTGSASFLKRSTKTSVVVQDGQSLVIGGIIQQTKGKGYSGIPFLSQIPLLGYLFRTTTETLNRTELIILITPRVIASPEEGQGLTEQFKGRVESLEPILKSMPQLPPLNP